MSDLLTLHHLQKRYGSRTVLQDLDFKIPRGSIFGLVGANGAGKTTTMRLILGLEKADAGTILINGEKVHYSQTKTNRMTGYLPDVPAFYDYMTSRDYLRLCADLTHVANAAVKIEDTLALVGLEEAHHRIHGFSRGMRQRLGIAQALLNDPELLICDEPTSALDPAGRAAFLNLLYSLKGRVTVLFSTHILSDVERISDYVGILHHGRLAACDTPAHLHATYGRHQMALTFATVAETRRCATHFQAPWHDCTVTITYQGSYAAEAHQVFQGLLAVNLMPVSLRRVDPTLDQIFMEVTQNETPIRVP
ncbi:ABC transporter ATP-binding protein [Levilactobacillus namurensis]|uniref:ABC transporter ATP-binding protein n=1 Tax=Levilactobacillus namurensis TaxID=380393 RepID=A0AAW8W744_9LACO|nr:ABC transporter ATP-binding protein [Levilactobacillus namurensis]MDT7014455.1 ABC transporter ATP-binding protein [Levilactobacillus namurensis]